MTTCVLSLNFIKNSQLCFNFREMTCILRSYRLGVGAQFNLVVVGPRQSTPVVDGSLPQFPQEERCYQFSVALLTLIIFLKCDTIFCNGPDF